MTPEQFPQLVIAFFVGLGLLLAGSANLLLRQKSLALRLPLTVLVTALMLGGVWAFTESAVSTEKAGLLLGAVLGLGMLAGSDATASVAATLRRPAVRWSLVAAAGITIASGSAVYSEVEESQELDRQIAELEGLTAPPPTAISAAAAATDRGDPIEIREAIAPRSERDLDGIEATIMQNTVIRDSIIRSEPATDRSNCHGWVFTGGRFWISSSEVERILAGNHYRPVEEPRPGDLVVYRSGSAIVHTGVVRYIAEGQPVIVEGKWGCTGVFLHSVGRSIYGSSYAFYRSTRAGHLLVGLDSTGSISPEASHDDEFTE